MCMVVYGRFADAVVLLQVAALCHVATPTARFKFWHSVRQHRMRPEKVKRAILLGLVALPQC